MALYSYVSRLFPFANVYLINMTPSYNFLPDNAVRFSTVNHKAIATNYLLRQHITSDYIVNLYGQVICEKK